MTWKTQQIMYRFIIFFSSIVDEMSCCLYRERNNLHMQKYPQSGAAHCKNISKTDHIQAVNLHLPKTGLFWAKFVIIVCFFIWADFACILYGTIFINTVIDSFWIYKLRTRALSHPPSLVSTFWLFTLVCSSPEMELLRLRGSLKVFTSDDIRFERREVDDTGCNIMIILQWKQLLLKELIHTFLYLNSIIFW